MYVRMIRKEKAGSMSGNAEKGRNKSRDNDWDWRMIFSGWFPEGTGESTALRLLRSGIPGTEEDVVFHDAESGCTDDVLVEIREEYDSIPVYKKLDGRIADGPKEDEKVKIIPARDGSDIYCKMLVLLPGERPYGAWICDRLEALQRAVGGCIEFTYPFRDGVTVIGNDEAKLIGMKGNRRINGEIYAGPLLLVGDDYDGDIMSLSMEQIRYYSKRFWEPETYTDDEVERSIKIEIFAI